MVFAPRPNHRLGTPKMGVGKTTPDLRATLEADGTLLPTRREGGVGRQDPLAFACKGYRP